MNKRNCPCPKCLPFVGKVFIDDVWSGADKSGISPVTGLQYPLLSDAIAKGLYHPRCKDVHSTYFEGISTPPEGSAYTADELDEMAQKYEAQQKQGYCERQEKRYDRMSRYSLDEDNKRIYGARAKAFGEKAEQFGKVAKSFEKPVEKSEKSGIIELTRKKGNNAQLESSISDKRFNELTIEARLTGAKIIRDDPWFNARMEEQNASAITYGDVLVFGKNATVSDVIEETYHYKQNLQGLNADKPHELRIILNEIDAKKYLIDNAKKFKIPRVETELTREQLKNYEEQLQDWYKRR